MQDKSWQMFLIVLGLFFIMISPSVPLKYALIITGVLCIVVGVYMIGRDKTKRK